MKKNIFTMVILSIIVIATLIYGFIDGGSPQAARNKRFDDLRIQNVQSIVNLITNYSNINKKLPPTILEASKVYQSQQIPLDPETNREYVYQVVSERDYKICATFSTSTLNNTPQYLAQYTHPTGFHCLSFSSNVIDIKVPTELVPKREVTTVPTKGIISVDSMGIDLKTSAVPQCKTPLESGMCQLTNCSYTYPNDIYIKGKVIVGDAYKIKYNRLGGVFNDECTIDGKSVNEAICSLSDDGNYINTQAQYLCPNGCTDGACIR